MIAVVVYLVAVLAFCLFVAWLSRRHGPEILIGLFATCVIISTVIAAKIFTVGGIALSATVMIYSMTFLCTDMLSEFYGEKAARKAILVALLADILFVGTVYAALLWPSAPFWDGQEAMQETLGRTPRIVVASVIAYVIAQSADVSIYHALKDRHGERFLWLRNNASTVVAQIIDSVIFYTIAFLGVLPIIELILWTIVAKIGIALLDTPVIYAARRLYRGAGGQETA